MTYMLDTNICSYIMWQHSRSVLEILENSAAEDNVLTLFQT